MYYVLIYQARCTDNRGSLRAAVLPGQLVKKFINKEIISNVNHLASPTFSIHVAGYDQKSFSTQKDAIKFCEEWKFRSGGLYTFRDAQLWLGFYGEQKPPMRLIKGGKFEEPGEVLNFQQS